MQDGSDPDPADVITGLGIASLSYGYGKEKYSSEKKENFRNSRFR
jgi:hypothetical protein